MEYNKMAPRKKKTEGLTNIVTVYKVTVPTYFVWPGSVVFAIKYTRAAAEQFVEDYPNKVLAYWMNIETEDIYCYETD